MSSSKSVVELNAVGDGKLRIISIKHCKYAHQYIVRYNDGIDVLSEVFKVKDDRYAKIINAFHSIKFYDDKIVFCLKSDKQKMFTFNRHKYVGLNEFLDSYTYLITSLSEAARFMKIIKSITGVKNVDEFVNNIGINSLLSINGKGIAIYRFTTLQSIYVNNKLIRSVFSELQKMGYYIYDETMTDAYVKLRKP